MKMPCFAVAGARGNPATTALSSAKVAVAVAMALGGLSVSGASAAGTAADSVQLEALQQQVQQLQRELDQLKARQDAAVNQNAASPSAAVNTARPIADGPGIHAGPLTVTLGGFTELTGIHRNRNETADVSSNFNTGIPFPNSPQYHLSELRATARQSRLSILTQGSQDGDATAEAYFELDFQSSAPTANSVESNSYNPRMRQIYATYNRKDAGFYLLAGQAFSLATLGNKGLTPRQERIPVTIDGQYVPGFNWTRNPQVRIVKNLGTELALGLSLESPQAVVFNGPNSPLVPTTFNNAGGFLYAPTTSYSSDVAPDVIAKVAWDPAFGHYELYGVGRGFRDRAGKDNATEFGGGVGGGFILPVIANQLDVQLSFLAGQGIGRYGSGQLPDVAIKPDGKLATVSEYEVLLGLIYRPATQWTVYAYAGVEHADAQAYTAVVNGRALGYGYGSPLYDNSGCLIEGSTVCAANTSEVAQGTLGMWWKFYDGPLGNWQFGLQGSYTRRRTFDGIGGSPDTDITTGMASFRYYPYQR